MSGVEGAEREDLDDGETGVVCRGTLSITGTLRRLSEQVPTQDFSLCLCASVVRKSV